MTVKHGLIGICSQSYTFFFILNFDNTSIQKFCNYWNYDLFQYLLFCLVFTSL